jgi:hypothetical protein
LSGCRICSKEGLQKLPWMNTLSSGGLHQTGKDAVGFQSAFRSRSEAYLAEDHEVPERLFRMIIWQMGTLVQREIKFDMG